MRYKTKRLIALILVAALSVSVLQPTAVAVSVKSSDSSSGLESFVESIPDGVGTVEEKETHTGDSEEISSEQTSQPQEDDKEKQTSTEKSPSKSEDDSDQEGVVQAAKTAEVEVADSNEASDTNSCGEQATYTLENGVLTISGKGAIKKEAFKGNSTIKSVIIEAGITEIGESAFYNCDSLTEVTIPDSVESIGQYAFYDCDSLTEVTIPDKVTTIGQYAFLNCDSLTKVTLGTAVKTIETVAFADCYKLTELTINSENIESLGSRVFSNTDNYITTLNVGAEVTTLNSTFYSFYGLKEINVDSGNKVYSSDNGVLYNKDKTELIKYPRKKEDKTFVIPDSVTSIGDSAFRDCDSLTGVTIPDSVESIGQYAFYDCDSLTEVTIPDKVTTIGQYAFLNCDSLTKVTLGTAVKTIETVAFADCYKLTELTINSENIESLGSRVFSNTDNYITTLNVGAEVTTLNSTFYSFYGLKEINVDSGNKVYSSDNGVLYNKDKTELIKYPRKKEDKTFVIPDSVTSIGDSAFRDCDSLTGVTIPDSVESIGQYAFYDCDSLTEVTIPDKVTTIGQYAFLNCDSLTKVTLGTAVKTIETVAFADCYKLTELTINSENIESLGSRVFSNTDNYITTLNVGAEVTTLNSTFYSFYGLKAINVDSENKAYSSDNGVLYNKDKTELIKYPRKKEDKTFVIPDSVTSIGDSAFRDCDSLTGVTIPDSVESIGQYAFYDCDSLTEVTIPDKVTTIGQYAFLNCDSLTKVTLGTAVKTIETVAFADCYKLTELTINSENIESLGSRVFSNTDNYITTLNVGAEVTTLNSTFYSFYGLKAINVDSENKAYSSDNGVLYNKAQTELIKYPRKMERTSYTVVDGTEKIANSAFYGNAYLLSVSIPDSVVTVGASAFYNCSKLERVTMESGTKEIGTSAFAYCYELSYIRIPETVTQIGSSVFSGSSKVIIYCDVNTVAAQYAANNNIAYVTSTNCITFTISKNCSVQTGNTAVKVPDNINQYRVSLFNQTTGKAITGYRVYASSIVLPMNEISAGDQIKVELVSKKGEAIDYHKVITLDQECKGTADFVVQQKGYISATPVTNTESTVLIYDKEGVLCDTLSTSGKTCTSTFLNAGAYQVLLIQGKSYLWNFERLATFQENGLTQGKDYILKQVNVSDGVITTMENIEIPQIDIELLKYLDSAKCSYTANTTEITSGGLLSMRLEYAFKELRKSEVSNVRLQISIPTGCTYVANSLTVDGTLSSKVTESSNSISIPLSDTKGVVRFQVKPIEYGTLSTTATISFTGSKRTMTESVGKINITVPYITLTCNTSTATKKMTVSGLTMPKTKVAIYDGTVRIGTATSNASGKWKAEVELHQATEGSTHRLTAKIKGGTEDEMVSAPVLVQYSPEAVVVKEFLMYYNGGNKMDLTNSAYTAKKVVSFNPAYPFTFTVKLSNNESVDRVYIVSTKGTETKSMKAYWDADTGLWVASGYFDNSNHSYVPGVLTVQFNEKQTSYKVNMEATVEEFQKDPLPDTITDGSCKIDKNSYDENSQTGEISGTYTLADDDHTQIEFQVKNETIEESKKDQYPIDSLEKDPDYIELDSDDSSKRHFTKVERDKKGRYIYTTVTYQKEKNSSGEDKWSPSKVATEIIFDLSLDATVDSVSDWIGGPAKTYGKIYGVGKDVIDGLKVCGRTLQIDYLYEAASKKLINMNLPEGEFEKRLEALQKWRTSAYLFCVGRAILVGASLATGLVTGPLGLCLTLSIALVSKLNEYCMEDMVDDLLNSILSYDCRWAVDPSGYVYEGVPSNRLPGVTATIYYKDEKSGQEKLWDASEYEQINPLITDADGSYAWDVPEGLWRVKYEKEGYTTTYSDWVPVPPIQTDINIGMVATAAPKVDQCELYDEYGIVTFSQYMQVSTVNDETITVCTGNGEPVPYSIQPINAEKESEQMLATKFKVQFDKKLSGGLYQVNMSKKVKNYADAALDADYETTITVQKTIEKLTVEVPAVLKNKQTVQIPVIIEPAGDYSDYTLTCSSSETDIAEVVSITQPNDKGVGYVTVTGKLPGSVKLVCKLEGTSIETSVIVAVQGKEEVLVEEKVLSNCTITLGSDTYTYDGKAKAPTVTVKDGTTTLTAGTDYEVVYANNTNVGTAKATVIGKGNYTGTVEKTFQINAASLSKATVTLAQTSVTYTGAAQTPAAAVTLNGKTLSTADYTVAYQNNTNAGTAKVTVTGKGNYTGTATAAFTIAKAGNTVTASSVNKIVSAKAQSFSIGAKAKGGAKLTYKSNNKSITVDKNGKVTVAKNYIGKATITISAAATTNYNAAVKQIYVTINPTGTKLSSVASAKTGQLTIKWAKNAAVTGYQVQYATSGKFNGAKTLNVKSNKTVTRTLSKLKEKQKYYVRIRTYKTVGKVNYYSAWSAAKSATVKGVTAPAAVKLTSVKSAKAGEMTVKWGKNAKAGGYQLQYATAKNFKSAKTVAVKKAKTTSTTIKKLTKGKKYYVRVRTYQKVSGKTYYSAWSGSKNVTIKK